VRQHETSKVSVEHGEPVQWHDGPNIPVQVYDNDRAGSMADTVSFVDFTITGTSNVRIIEKNPKRKKKTLCSRPPLPNKSRLTLSSAVTAAEATGDS
jgi:hypothetical protein